GRAGTPTMGNGGVITGQRPVQWRRCVPWSRTDSPGREGARNVSPGEAAGTERDSQALMRWAVRPSVARDRRRRHPLRVRARLRWRLLIVPRLMFAIGVIIVAVI